MADLKTLMPHIRRAAVANITMIIYFLSPSFLSFVAILLAIAVILFDNPTDKLKSILNCQEDCSTTKCVNQSFDKFKKLDILEKLLLLVVIKLAVDFSWLIPSWVLIFLATEVFAAWGFLKQFGIIELGTKYVNIAQQSVHKVINMVPRYQKV